MIAKKLIALTVTLITFAPVVNAAMTVPFGFYVGTNQGVSHAYNKSYPGSSVHHNGYGLSVEAGYKINLYLAAEVSYSHFAPTTVKNSVGAQAASDSHYGLDLAAKLMLPIGNSGADLYGKLGVSRITSNLSVNHANAALNNLIFNDGKSNTTGYFGAAGAEYSITSHLVGDAQWARSQGNSSTGNANLTTLGLAYIF